MMPTRQEIEDAIQTSIRQALNRELPPITLDTSMISDLGVDSLDLVEIVYGVEEAFDVEIAAEELFPQRLLRDPTYVQEGKISAEGVAKLREQFSWTDLPEIAPGTDVNDIPPIVSTVRVFTDYVEHVIRRQREA
jgi:acyl carrier protein